jgi:hypothetical protein
MRRLTLAIAAALVLSTAAVPKHAAAQTAATASEPATANTGSIHKTVVCGPKGCKHYWPRPYLVAVPPPVFPPACPIDYYYACKQGPLGYGQCACWPYRTGWAW